MQTQTDQINVRIDTGTKLAAEAVFGQLGLSATDAVRMFYRQVAMRQGLPFEARIVNPPVTGKKKLSKERIKKFVQKHKSTLIELAGR
jgi:addiction module RelB/DinJ family antitoxin